MNTPIDTARSSETALGSYQPLAPGWSYALDASPPLNVAHPQRDDAVDAYASGQGLRLFNGPTVCLEGLDPASQHLELSVGEFYDLILRTIIDPDPAHPPKSIAVSVLMKDAQGDVLLTKRTNDVALGRGLVSTTATGALEPDDFLIKNSSLEDFDPFKYRAVLELEEELGLKIGPEHLETRGIFIGTRKRQPVVLLDGRIDEPFPLTAIERHLGRISEDDVQEAASLLLVSREDLLSVIEPAEMTEAATFHMMHHAAG